MALQELIYTSVTSTHCNQNGGIKNILGSSERNNALTSITGLLLHDGKRYIQILEGEAKNVDHLYEVICNDSRHHGIELLHKGSIVNRSFQTWKMAYEFIPAGLLEGLAENMAVFSMELGDAPLEEGESFGAKLDVMFMRALAAE